jgi:hypothetical protein
LQAPAAGVEPSPVLRLADCRAVLAGSVPESLLEHPRVARVEARAARRSVAPAAAYAVDAVRALTALPDEAALFTFAGPPGSCLHLFDPAHQGAPDGRLVGAGFALERSRRIHPFTLLLALENQVAATLSLELGLRGPCCSTTGSAAAFADLLPNMALAARTRPVLAVLASAAGRGEDRSRGVHLRGVDAAVEGAVALLFTVDGGLGRIAPDDGAQPPPGRSTANRSIAGASTAGVSTAGAPTASPRFAPALEPGLSILDSIGGATREARLAIHDAGRTTTFRWSSP